MTRIHHDPEQGVLIGIGRVDIIRRVGNLVPYADRRRYKGRDVQRWLDMAVNGDADDLRLADAQIARLGF